MSTSPSPEGETSRISVEEASAVVNGVPLIDFAAFSIDVDDPSERERSVDGNTLHFDQMLEPSGSCEVFPTSTSAVQMFNAIKNRRIGNVRYTLPDEDTRGGHAIKGVRFTNVSQDDLGSDGYSISADWRGDYFVD